MVRFELLDTESKLGQVVPSAEMFFKLGMMYSDGHSVPADLVSAHKWFNIAATHDHSDAVRMRREIASELSASDLAAAQRGARDWLRRH